MNFPDGLNRTLALFSRATYNIVNNDELKMISKKAPRKEKKLIKAFEKGYQNWHPEQFRLWQLFPVLQRCPHLLADIIGTMVLLDDSKLTQEELEVLFRTEAPEK